MKKVIPKITIGGNIRLARERCNMSLSQLAAIARLTDTTMQSIEDGKNVNEQIVYRVAGYLMKTYRTSYHIDEFALARAINVVPSIVAEMERGMFSNPHMFRQSINALDIMIGYEEQHKAIDRDLRTQNEGKTNRPNNSVNRSKAKLVETIHPKSQNNNRNKRKDIVSKNFNSSKVHKKNVHIYKEPLSSYHIHKAEENRAKRVWEKNRRRAQAIMTGAIVLPKPPAIYPEPSFLKQNLTNTKRTNDIATANATVRTEGTLPSQLKRSNGVHGDYEML